MNMYYKILKVIRQSPQQLRNLSTHRTGPPWDVAFFGTDDFSLSTLQLLANECRKQDSIVRTLDVITTVKSKPNTVHRFASKENLTIHKWPPETANWRYHLGIVVSFGHLIPVNIINAFPLGILNVHASLLPRWRGAAPIIYALANGDTETGVTIMKIRPLKFDVGEIVAQSRIAVPNDMRMPQLYAALAQLGAETLLETLRQLLFKLDNEKLQPSEDVTYAPKIDHSIAVVNWKVQTSTSVYNLSRALDSLYLVSSMLNNDVVKLDGLAVTTAPSINHCVSPGQILYTSKRLLVCCAHHTWISVTRLVVNKKNISAHDFNNGYLKKLPHERRVFR